MWVGVCVWGHVPGISATPQTFINLPEKDEERKKSSNIRWRKSEEMWDYRDVGSKMQNKG